MADLVGTVATAELLMAFMAFIANTDGPLRIVGDRPRPRRSTSSPPPAGLQDFPAAEPRVPEPTEADMAGDEKEADPASPGVAGNRDPFTESQSNSLDEIYNFRWWW